MGQARTGDGHSNRTAPRSIWTKISGMMKREAATPIPLTILKWTSTSGMVPSHAAAETANDVRAIPARRPPPAGPSPSARTGVNAIMAPTAAKVS